MRRAVITVSFGNRANTGKPEGDLIGTPFSVQLERWRKSFSMFTPDADLIVWDKSLPPGSPTHEEKPYAFKAWALLDALKNGYEQVVWADTAVYYNRTNADDLWRMVGQGNFIARNPWNCGQWTCDRALAPLGINREEAFYIPQIIATAFGLDLRSVKSVDLLDKLIWMTEQPDIFPGPWVNDKGQASPDSRVLGHRHDQTAMSVIVRNMGLATWPQPVWASYFQTKYGR